MNQVTIPITTNSNTVPQNNSHSYIQVPTLTENVPENTSNAPDEIPNNSQRSDTPHSQSSNQPDQEPGTEFSTQPPVTETLQQAIETPIPPDADDGLLCDLLLSEDVESTFPIEANEVLAWRFEFELPATFQDHHPMTIDDVVLLATNQKKQRTEVKLCHLSPSEREEFEKAKSSEVNNWLQTGTVCKALRESLAPEQILRCRWIHVWKHIEDPLEQKKHGKTRKAKSRLVVLGYMDPDLETIPRDSPTLNRQSRMLILQLISSMQWSLMSFDIKAAFLQGKTQDNRKIGLEPVPELAKAMGLKDDRICKLEKSAYGLIDAPFLWYRELDNTLKQLSFVASPFDPCTYVLYKPGASKPSGIIGMHVDDGLCGGDEYFQQQLQRLEAKYPFGAKKNKSFTFTGIELTQLPDYSIILSQEKYVTKIEPIHIRAERKTQLEQPVSDEERLGLRALVGSLQYAAVADALTKVMQTAFLRQILAMGQYRVHDESQVLKERATSRSRIQWLQQEKVNREA
eukprot:s1339_g11.t1